jgi:hypothetical protein
MRENGWEDDCHHRYSSEPGTAQYAYDGGYGDDEPLEDEETCDDEEN